jgi:hypothetical protein
MRRPASSSRDSIADTRGLPHRAAGFRHSRSDRSRREANSGGNSYEPDSFNFDDYAGFRQIFDGDTPKDSDGNPDIKRVKSRLNSTASFTCKPEASGQIWRR